MIVAQGHTVAVSQYRGTNEEAQIVRNAVQSFCHLIKASGAFMAVKRFTFGQFAELIEGHYQGGPRIARTVAVLRSVDLRNSDPAIDGRLAEAFLAGEPCADPVAAHMAVMAIYAAGSNRYPTLWDRASRYASSQECVTLAKLARL
ncbi:hypothetical protein RY831_14885 [Noviherbaspirillum sp. CPCC 100848]|uniref:Uncharacterized protein n=1 Tax=Noviherbaspirillum album TaxID=3080276 RepID=A0ABU6J9Z8_9BURK|nr:hypothetical protein [Noviherbaspirillum sp. CPCC 100848]MEC4720446.1 hypothetical protein [Noviherbaspirillum sp. CPCC 100848]